MITQGILYQITDRCIHFSGMMDTACKAGITYPRDNKPFVRHIACFKKNGITCPKQQFPTQDEAQQQAQELLTAGGNAIAALDAVKSHYNATGHRAGMIKCPAQPCTGMMQYFVAETNEHITAHCAQCKLSVRQ